MASRRQTETESAEEEGADHTSKLPDDILVQILSLLRYKEAMRTASVSRRWERLLAQLPYVELYLSQLELLKSSLKDPSEQRVESMARTLHRRCHEEPQVPITKLRLVYRKDVPMESRHADDFIALANATELVLCVECSMELPGDDAGDWSLRLPPATVKLEVQPWWYAVRPPHIHNCSNLLSLKLHGATVVRHDFPLTATVFPSLEDLHISDCTLAATISITSDTMPRLKHLRFTDVNVMTDETKAAVNVLVDELRTLHMSCPSRCRTTLPTKKVWYSTVSRYNARFAMYSSFRLRAPRLRVFDWRCCYAEEVRIESVGHLSEVAVKVAAGRMRTPFLKEPKDVTIQQRDDLMTNILLGLMPGLQPCRWENIKRKCLQRDQWLCFEVTRVHPLITE